MNNRLILGLLIAVICRLPTKDMLIVIVLGIIAAIIIGVFLDNENENLHL